MIGVVDYEAGNIASVSNALSAIRAEFVVSADCRQLEQCSGIILPGVGAAPEAMASLVRRKLTGFLKDTPVPLLGICLGMQLLYERSDEGPTRCLAVVAGTVTKFGPETPKVPHMGWNTIERRSPNALVAGIPEDAYFYFAHSYYAPVGEVTSTVTAEGMSFSSVIQHGHYYGVQFHPEKSGQSGLKVLANFVDLCR